MALSFGVFMKLKILSLDISMSNLGMAKAIYDTETKQLTITECMTISPVITKTKTVRQNSKDIERAKQLFDGLFNPMKDADIVCAEVPVGSQSARAMCSYGISVAILAAVAIIKPNFIEVSPLEVKLTVGSKTASKTDVIKWVVAKHPTAPLELYRGQINLSKAEHQADAIVAIHAAMKTPLFKQIINLYKDKP